MGTFCTTGLVFFIVGHGANQLSKYMLLVNEKTTFVYFTLSEYIQKYAVNFMT